MAHYVFMWKMMEQYSFETDPQLSIYVKCIICNNLLNDACQGPCGCLFCKKCIDKYLTESNKFCPGNHKECALIELDLFSNIVKDNSANNKVSKLQVTCPAESCGFQCPLIEMSNHLQTCTKLPLSCPYREIGCATKAMLMDKLADHLQTEIIVHNKLLVKWIINSPDANQRNIQENSDVLVENEMNDVFQTITEILAKKQILIDDMFKKLKDLKEKISEISQVTKPVKSIINKNNKELLAMKEANEKLSNQMKFEINSELKKVQQEYLERIQINEKVEKELVDVQKKLKKLEIFTSSSSFKLKCNLEKVIKIASYRWDIENMKEIRCDGEEMIYSDLFYSIDRKLKMRLWMYPNGLGNNFQDEISIQLLIWDCENDNTDLSKFPFKADITISIRNSIKPQIYQSISQLCLIEKPDIFIYSTSELFNFNYTHLNLGGIFANQFATVECVVSIYK